MDGSARYLVLGVRRPGVTTDVFEGVEDHPEGRRRVVIKRVRDPEDSTTIRAFFEECRVLEQLSHPNIVRLYDVGTEGDRPFQVFEAVDGWDAGTLIAKSKELGLTIPMAIGLYVAREIAIALHYAHERPGLELVHRDVSPDNILLAFDGRVLLADFGIALFTERSRNTQLGMTRGKLAYMSPEQVMAGHLDRRSDVFSLGCVLHALVTGASPLEDAGNRDRLLMQEPLALSDGLPPNLRAIIARALAPDRRHRYQDAIQLANDCSQSLGDEPAKDEIVDLLAELAADDAPTRIVEELPSHWTLELESTDGELRTFTASSLSGNTEPRSFTKTEPRARPPVTEARTRRPPWVLLGFVAALALTSSIFLATQRPRPPATPVVTKVPSPTPQVVPGTVAVEAPPVIATEPSPRVEPEPKRARRRSPAQSAEAKMNGALERLVKSLQSNRNALRPEALEAFESRYLELGTEANRATNAEERLRLARRAEMLLLEVEKTAARTGASSSGVK